MFGWVLFVVGSSSVVRVNAPTTREKAQAKSNGAAEEHRAAKILEKFGERALPIWWC